MKKRYIVCINNSTQAQDEKFVEFARNNNISWWHWLSNTWLLSEKSGKLGAADIRDALRDIYNDEYNMVIEISAEKDSWAGFGPKSEEKNMFKWIKKQLD